MAMRLILEQEVVEFDTSKKFYSNMSQKLYKTGLSETADKYHSKIHRIATATVV